MKIEFKTAFLVFGVTAMTALFTARSSSSNSLELLSAAEEREMGTTATFIENQIADESDHAASLASMVASYPFVKADFRAGDRDSIVHRLRLLLPVQHDQFGVVEAQFFTPPATNFVRLSNPSLGIGEDLSAVRELIVTTSRQQEARRGVDLGRHGPGIRGVEPVRDAQGMIGLFEINVDFSTVLASIRRSTGYEAGVFVDAARMSRISNLTDQSDRSRTIGGYRNVGATDWPAIARFVTPDLMERSHGVATRVIDNGTAEARGLVLVPLRDFKNAPIGSVIAVRSFREYAREMRRAHVVGLAFALAQSVVLGIVTWLVVYLLLMQPIAALAARLRNLVARPRPEPGATGLQRQEISSLARAIEFLAGRGQSPVGPQGGASSGS